jgi:hypothetical protein
VYAESVVRDILKGREGKIWHGAGAGGMKWMLQVMPGGMMVCLFFSLLFVFVGCFCVFLWVYGLAHY